MARHPNNGPTFSKPTITRKPFAPPSLDHQKAQADEEARAASKQRRFRTLFRTNPTAWFAKYFEKEKD
jgi:hypothetical protein